MNLLEIKGIGTSPYTVALDVDGVLADFEAKVKDVFGKDISEINTRKLWAGVVKYDREVEPFFENLPVMDDAYELIRFVDNNFSKWFLLTASGYVPKNVEEQKRRWAAKVISPKVDAVVVRKSTDKAQYATPTTILVDDRMKSIEPWRQAGGIGILHTSAKDTIAQLQQFLKNQ
jgi:hypothetical protein